MAEQWGPYSVAGKSVIVTGGAKGIGLGIARRFAEGGANVLLVDQDHVQASRALAQLSGPGKFVSMGLDVSEDDAGRRMVEFAVSELDKLDVLINNAGIYPQAPMLSMTHKLWDKVQAVNLRGLAFACQAAGRYFVARDQGGCIVNIASVDSVHPSMVGLAAYDASKGGVLSFTKNFALEMATHKVRVNAVEPGPTATPGTLGPPASDGPGAASAQAAIEFMVENKIPLRRIGTPDDIAKATVFLASEAASFITGASLVVDGGMLLT